MVKLGVSPMGVASRRVSFAPPGPVKPGPHNASTAATRFFDHLFAWGAATAGAAITASLAPASAGSDPNHVFKPLIRMELPKSYPGTLT
jgi:hypothetical protein